MTKNLFTILHSESTNLESILGLINDYSISDLEHPICYGLNSLHHLICFKNLQIIQEIIKNILNTRNVCNNKDNKIIADNIKFPYLHFSALAGDAEITKEFKKLGRHKDVNSKDILDCLLSLYKNNENCICFDSPNLKEKCKHLLDFLINNTNRYISSIDIAAICRNEECLMVLLINTSILSKNTNISTLVSKSMENDSFFAFKYYTIKADEDIMSIVFLDALRLLKEHFIKYILKCPNFNLKKTFKSTNPYHVTYHQTKIISKQTSLRYQNLDSLTKYLIESGFNVNCQLALGHYPLYSLIHSLVREKDANPNGIPTYHIHALKLLLTNEADPNYNEIKQKCHYPTFNQHKERDLYYSALDAFLSSLQSCDTWCSHVMEHLDRVWLILLEHRADPCSEHPDTKETPLHSLMRLAANQHAMGHVHADLSSMSRMVLYFGADPNNFKNNCISYPVCHYFTCLFRAMGGTIAYERWWRAGLVPQILNILVYMDQNCANEVANIIKLEMQKALKEADGMSEEVYMQVSTMIMEYTHNMKSLQDLCKISLWKMTNRRVGLLKHLHMPKVMHKEIKNFFALDI